MPLKKVQKPTITFLVGDANYAIASGYSAEERSVIANANSLNKCDKKSYYDPALSPHAGRSMIAFADGHTAGMTAYQLRYQTTLPIKCTYTEFKKQLCLW